MSATTFQRRFSRLLCIHRHMTFRKEVLVMIYLVVVLGSILLVNLSHQPSSRAHGGPTCTKSEAMMLNFSEVHLHRSHLRLARIGNKRKPWAAKKYSLDESPGVGHYALLGYLSSRYQHIVV